MAKIRVKQIRSTIDRPFKQKLVIKALGLGKINRVKEHNDTPQIRGMIFKVKHLLQVSPIDWKYRDRRHRDIGKE